MKQPITKKTEPLELYIKLKHDGTLPIATGRTRMETNWKNKEMAWSELLQKLRFPTRTQETHLEFMAMEKPDQDRIKDVGGFVGGHLKGGRRRSGTVELRQIITIDMDFAPPEILDDIQTETLPMPGAWAVYSTHKHDKNKPRLRFLLPLTRPVTPDQYEAITRRIAADININYCDDTTYQPSRLMYWPSVSSDSDYVFWYSDEEWTDPDKILQRYTDWTDTSYWPTSEREKKKIQHEAKKQGDPREKQGLIGAFCRTYTIPEAMEAFIPGVYTPCETANRYTYAAGSTAAGLVIYEDGLFAYSNHSTDPAGGQLCNAFDLVRIHLFGAQDENIEDTPTTKLPSYKAMISFVQKDRDTNITLAKEKLASVSEDFGEPIDEDGDEEDLEWTGGLTRNKAGELEKSLPNLQLILKNDRLLQGIRRNRLSDLIEVTGRLPWKHAGLNWTDTDDAMLERYLAGAYTEFPKQKVITALTAAAEDRAYDPVLDYLAGLPEWDGSERVDTLLVDVLGAEDTEYVRAVTRKTLVGAIARVKKPGCKFDTVLTICGPQGIGKSTLLDRLGGRWFCDTLSFADTRDKTAAEKLQGNWIVEIQELNGLSKSSITAMRQFISTRNDKYRPAYGRRVEEHPRRCIMVGTTNAEEGYLQDTAGGRRFWPVNVGSGIRTTEVWDLTQADIDQIWAEALVRYEAGEPLILTGRLAEEAERAQLDALKSDEREGIVREYLDRLLPEDWDSKNLYERRDFLRGTEEGTVRRQAVCSMEIWCECLEYEKKTLVMKESREIIAMLKKIGWELGSSGRIPIYGRQRLFHRPVERFQSKK